jgi:RNA 2',3'-cyclic 3'-phosphodiesterase
VTDERARLFVALELPEPVRATLVRWGEGVIRRVEGVRAVPPASLHVTLCFLGGRPLAELPQIAAACSGVRGSPVVHLSLDEAGWLPRRRPAVLAIRLTDHEGLLGGVQAKLADAMGQRGFYEAESRRFLPHVTVARVRRPARLRGEVLPPVPPMRFDGARITLFRSRLDPDGARYEALETINLGG